MLVLSRKINESVMIGNEVEVIILEIREGNIKLGIKAPLNITIHRKEVYEEILNENKRATSVKKDDMQFAAEAFKDCLPKKTQRRNQNKEDICSENLRSLTSRNMLPNVSGIFHLIPEKPKPKDKKE